MAAIEDTSWEPEGSLATPASPSAAERSAHPWLEAGANVLAFPVTVAVVALVAPLMWMFGPRSHE